LLPGTPVFINDVALDNEGNAYATNSAAPVIYKITAKGEASIFFQDASLALPTGQFGFNGIEFGNSGYLLVAYSSPKKILKLPVKNPAGYTTVNLNATLNGPDGLLLSNDGKQLIVVNNAGGSAEGSVQSFKSDNKWDNGTIDQTYSTGAVFPTTATSDGKNIFVLYAYLHLRATGQSAFVIQPINFNDNRPFK
jgi:sugar lactone lactonase YvrE